jgi:hypothetical protein
MRVGDEFMNNDKLIEELSSIESKLENDITVINSSLGLIRMFKNNPKLFYKICSRYDLTDKRMLEYLSNFEGSYVFAYNIFKETALELEHEGSK